MIIAAGDGVYKLDYNKVLEYHIEKRADITVVCKPIDANDDISRFGCLKMNEDSRIVDFEESLYLRMPIYFLVESMSFEEGF